MGGQVEPGVGEGVVVAPGAVSVTRRQVGVERSAEGGRDRQLPRRVEPLDGAERIGDQILVDDVGDAVVRDGPGVALAAVTASICISRPMAMNSTRTECSTWSECM